MHPDYDEFLSITYYDKTKFQPTEMFKNGNCEIFVHDTLQLLPDLSGAEFLERIEGRDIIIGSFFWGPLNDINLAFAFEFIDYHLQKYAEKNGNGFIFLLILEEVIKDYSFLDETREQSILEWISIQKKEYIHSNPQSRQRLPAQNQVTWHGTPSQLGYLFNELVNKGFIEPPLYNGEFNYTGLAKFCYSNFKVNTTQENLIKEMNPSKNTLSETKRSKFTIPDITDLA